MILFVAYSYNTTLKIVLSVEDIIISKKRYEKIIIVNIIAIKLLFNRIRGIIKTIIPTIPKRKKTSHTPILTMAVSPHEVVMTSADFFKDCFIERFSRNKTGAIK